MIAPFFLIIGNHDRPNNSVFLNNKHAFNSYKRWNNVCIVDEVVSITLKNNKFLFVPYVPNKRFIEAINTKIKTEELVEYVAIFCHQEFYGCKIGSKISEGGDKMEDVNLNENISKRFPIIISGHIHDYERLGNNEIIYVGTPVQQTFAESHDKAISLFTFFHDENKNENNENKTEWEEERIHLGLKRKITLQISANDLANFVPDMSKNIRLIVTGTESEIKTISKTTKFQELKKEGIKIELKTIQTEDVNNKAEFKKKVSYEERLLSEINNDKSMLKWFNQIFV